MKFKMMFKISVEEEAEEKNVPLDAEVLCDSSKLEAS